MTSFTVTRSSQSMVIPAEPTPSVTLSLSAIDRVPELRHMVRSLHVFALGRNPAKLIRSALSKALVKYYPMVGRFKGSPDRDEPVRVECTGQGAWFAEATVNCKLEDVRYLDHPLMISPDDLLPVVVRSRPPEIIEPLDLPFMMQVTEFTCGGFVVGIISVHTMADGLGSAQFVNAISEIARGLNQPTVEPVWHREVIPRPPKPRSGPPSVRPSLKLLYSTMDISVDRIDDIKGKYIEVMGQRCSTFDVAVAFAWRSRTRAIRIDDEDADAHLCFFANARRLLAVEGSGYYGNCFLPTKVAVSSGRLVRMEVVEVVKLIRDAKLRLGTEFGEWVEGKSSSSDPWEMNFGYNSLFVSDWTKLGFGEVDYGWGNPKQIIPFAYYDFMAVAILGSPPAPKKGARLMTQCVREEHLAALHHEIMLD